MTTPKIVRVAAAHIAPVLLDKAATTEKAIRYLNEAAHKGAHLVTFPESFIPGFPVWAGLWAPMDNHYLFKTFVEARKIRPKPIFTFVLHFDIYI